MNGAFGAEGIGEIDGEEIALKMTTGGSGTGTPLGESFERLEIGFSGREHQTDPSVADRREIIARLIAGLLQRMHGKVPGRIIEFIGQAIRRHGTDNAGLETRMVEASTGAQAG